MKSRIFLSLFLFSIIFSILLYFFLQLYPKAVPAEISISLWAINTMLGITLLQWFWLKLQNHPQFQAVLIEANEEQGNKGGAG